MSSEFERANELFVDECFNEALEFYNKAISKEERDEFFVNRSACHQKLGNKKQALEDADKAISLNSQNSKAHFRRGIALFDVASFAESKKSFEKAIELNPSQTSWTTWLQKCKEELKETDHHNPSPSLQTTSSPQTSSIPQTTSTPQTTSAPPQTSTQNKGETTKIRQEWYQTSTHVIITLFAKNVAKENLSVEITEKKVDICLKLGDGREYVSEVNLLARVVPKDSTHIIYSTKIEIKLKKEQEAKWDSLEYKESALLRSWDTASKPNPPSYPTSSKKPVNWDKIDDKDEEPQGEEALNKLFKDIYRNGSEEQRRAMMKSFQESGGTVLSTNWDEVKQKKVEGSPPEGLVMKNWKDL